VKIIGERLYLKLLSVDDVTEDYLRWMQDPEILQYLESRWRPFTLEDLKTYVRTVNDGLNNFMFGIYLKTDDRYIGNIKVGGVNLMHRYADVGLIIGDKSAWGKGYGTDAINLITTYAFEELNLNKVVAGIYDGNIGSIKAFRKAGYREVGILKRHRFCQGKFVDELLFEKCRI
jgi:RimJ/RimL family protein N-acetyltransferase